MEARSDRTVNQVDDRIVTVVLCVQPCRRRSESQEYSHVTRSRHTNASQHATAGEMAQ